MKKFYTLLFGFALLFSASAWADDYNIYGSVTCSGVGVEGVVVSDGFEFTQTDSLGNYYLYSKKKNGYVFYVIPSGYMPYENASYATAERIFGGFWQTLTYPTKLYKVERHNFKLKVVNNDNHIMFFQADPQIGNRTDDNDKAQYEKMYFPRTATEYADAGTTPAYTTVLGDLAWDYYWYSRNYALPSYKSTIVNHYKEFQFRHFSVMGNHDNDGATPCTDSTDFEAAAAFRTNMGPNYYSYNIGKIHYIVFDDIVYINSGEPDGTGCKGSRNYSCYITDDQLKWIEKDLSYVDKNTTIFLSTHSPLWGLDSNFSPYPILTNSSSIKLCNLVKGYKAVHIFSGHRHNTYNIEPTNYGYNNIYEHNLGAVGGNLWWAGYYTGHPNCNDGTPGGWQMFYVYGDSITWQFHDLEDNGNAQFRIMDGNTIKQFYNEDATYAEIRNTYSGRQNWSTLPANTILVNVFNYDPKWTVEIYEGSTKLSTSRWRCEDIYHTLTYDIPRFKARKASTGTGNYTTDNATNWNLHTFRATASSATSSITVKVTDRFGNVYKKTVSRPIPCTVDALTPGGEEMILTGIQERMQNLGKTNVYSRQGTLNIEATQAGTATISTLSGMSRTVSLSAGHNSFPVQEGIYIVTYQGQSTKLLVK